ncbi:ABC transporter permease [Shimazuella sp. AN120528]|uniref:ABC transporter permease n=1 Tax=Shimazuella soli TaxID=1892854 RepID=UPI001F0E9E4F|nr:ABC transporter permease [Shimazuella soli]MCH5583985.1 ABC transporter permease [Shimazuella soli]
MNYFTLALSSIRRNGRANLAYFLSNLVFIVIYFLGRLFMNHPMTYKYFHDGDGFALYGIFYLILFTLFLITSTSFYLQTRKKEIALYSLHGASFGQIGLLIMLENMVVGFFVIVTGIVVGLSLSKLFFILITPMLGTPIFTFYLSFEVIWDTVSTFGCFYIVQSILLLFMIRSNKVIKLLKERRLPTNQRKLSMVLFVIGLVLTSSTFLVPYYQPTDLFLFYFVFILAYISPLVGFYLILANYSTFYCQLTKRNDPEQPTHVLRRSRQLFQSKSIPLMGAISVFFLWLSLSSIIDLLSTYDSTMGVYKDYPFTYYLFANEKDKSKLPVYDRLLQRQLTQKKVNYKNYSFEAIILREKSGGYIRAIRYSDYQSIAAILGRKHPRLQDAQIIYLATREGNWIKQKHTENTLRIQKYQHPFQIQAIDKNIIPRHDVIVVSDKMFIQLSTIKTTSNYPPYRQLPDEKYIAYLVPQWMKNLPKLFDQEVKVSDSVSKSMMSEGFGIDSRPGFSLADNSVLSLLEAIVYFFAGVSFLYFQSYMKLEEEKEQYQILSKLGWSEKEMYQLGTWQMFIYFFIPFILGVIQNVLLNPNNLAIVSLAMGIQSLALIVYFVFARSSYLRKAIPKKEVL